MKLTEHFTLEELSRSATALRLEIDNTPPPEILPNLRRLCAELEKVRSLIIRPLKIHSAYRCPALNTAVGGAARSYHMRGLAADFDPPPAMSHDQLQKAIAAAGTIVFDLILEERAGDGAHWLHFQVPETDKPARRLVRDAELTRQGGAITRTTAG